ncbi:MAG: hypothetical protein QXR48_01670 [Candidatus Woesearchaeota archaeon]
MNRENLIEIIFLIIVFGCLLYIGPGEVFQHQLKHEKPVQFGATDGFLYVMLTRHVAETGNFRYNPFYSVAGFNDSIAYHPPLMMHITAAFSHISGLKAHDALSLIMALCAIFGAFIVYWLIRSYNKSVAMLAAPLFVFLYVYKFIIGYTWGEALLYGGSFFLIALFFMMSRPELKHWWVPAGILIGAVMSTHTSEAIFFYGFVVFFLAVKFLLKKLTKSELKWWLKQLGFATILALALSFNYLIIFYNGYYKITGEAYTSLRPMSPEEFGAIQVPPLNDFKMFAMWAIIIGAMLALLLVRKEPHTALLALGFMLLVGLSNYIGLHYRAFQTRFLWPIYLALFFGIAVYFVLKQFHKGGVIVPAILALAIAAFFVHSYHMPMHPDMIYDGQWEGFKWVEQNTPERSRILFLYGDGYSQSLRLIQRLVFLLDPNDFVAMAQEGRFRRMIKTEPILVSEMYLIYRKNLFDFGFYGKEQNLTIFGAPMDICGFDYYVVDRQSAYAPQLVQIAAQLGSVIINHNATPVFQNDQIVILKNNNVGGECIA